jgi:hypothetical protein
MDGKTRYVYFGLGVSSVLSLVFIVLRIMGHIKWSLWWTLSPLWILFSAILGVFGMIGVLYIIHEIYEHRKYQDF